ncbi:putative Transmembrane protein [Quillaja saponaria]|uniref:Transmembrane protein n=1 Tax=Quillaja saponaria TaxID=32244 RepID=A0AAD7PAV1_QUISA|nr:putative Transmembrane protein [Quillaja saponaria]
METQSKEDNQQEILKNGKDQVATTASAVGWKGALGVQYREIKENVETYPYVWASYIVVYGGLALWGTYRWRKLRNTENRVRALQERLKRLEAQESATSIPTVEKAPPSADKSTK